MQIHFTRLILLPLALTFSFILSPAGLAQPSADQQLTRLKHRYQINDIDGIGELIDPLWQRLVRGDAEFDVTQQHLVAMATVKFYVRTGEHHRAILPYLVGMQTQQMMKTESLEPLIEPLDDAFGVKYIPPVFFSEQDQKEFRANLDAAIDQGVIHGSQLAATYREANPDRLEKIPNEMLASIIAAKADASPSDRTILKLIESFVTHQDQQWTLSHESLATAIEALQRMNRNGEADRLRVVFRTQFPDSRRLER